MQGAMTPQQLFMFRPVAGWAVLAVGFLVLVAAASVGEYFGARAVYERTVTAPLRKLEAGTAAARILVEDVE